MKALWDKYANALFGIISRTVQDKHYAEEVLQETMLKIWKGIGSFDSNKASFFTWASRIARNSSLDLVRLKSYDRSIKTKEIDPTVFNIKTAKTNLAGIDSEKLLSVLDEKHREVIEAGYLMGFTQQEIADRLEIPLGTVKTRMRNGIKQLRNYLKQEKKMFFGIMLIIAMFILI